MRAPVPRGRLSAPTDEFLLPAFRPRARLLCAAEDRLRAGPARLCARRIQFSHTGRAAPPRTRGGEPAPRRRGAFARCAHRGLIAAPPQTLLARPSSAGCGCNLRARPPQERASVAGSSPAHLRERFFIAVFPQPRLRIDAQPGEKFGPFWGRRTVRVAMTLLPRFPRHPHACCEIGVRSF